ncbi:hypothetical protein NL676_002765 [Syzygium grande]|nr:hypothetical protein NL676_002765 [Syzygium grande]
MMKKLLIVGVILLFFVGTLVQPNEAGRVLIKGKEEAQANDQPSILVLQTLEKGKTPCTGDCKGYTPGSSTNAGTTSTKAFAGRSAVGMPPHYYSDRVLGSGAAADRK